MPIRVYAGGDPVDPHRAFVDYIRALLNAQPGDLPRAAVEAALNDLEK